MPNAGRREKGPKCGSLPLNAGELAALLLILLTVGSSKAQSDSYFVYFLHGCSMIDSVRENRGVALVLSSGLGLRHCLRLGTVSI